MRMKIVFYMLLCLLPDMTQSDRKTFIEDLGLFIRYCKGVQTPGKMQPMANPLHLALGQAMLSSRREGCSAP